MKVAIAHKKWIFFKSHIGSKIKLEEYRLASSD